MKQYYKLINQTSGKIILPRAQLCKSYWCHLVGLQFRRHLPEDEGLLFITATESRLNTTIHMLNMFIAISVIWMDKNQRVVDKQLAKPWRLAYTPSAPAKYYLESCPHISEYVDIGDLIEFEKAM